MSIIELQIAFFVRKFVLDHYSQNGFFMTVENLKHMKKAFYSIMNETRLEDERSLKTFSQCIQFFVKISMKS